jgi:hypothetical protein
MAEKSPFCKAEAAFSHVLDTKINPFKQANFTHHLSHTSPMQQLQRQRFALASVAGPSGSNRPAILLVLRTEFSKENLQRT